MSNAVHIPNLGKRLAGVVVVTTIVLLLPLTAMQFTPAVRWDLADFSIAGTLLLGAGLLYTLLIQPIKQPHVRLTLGLLLLAALGLIWAELAVGIFN